jgi:hypothetical protein
MFFGGSLTAYVLQSKQLRALQVCGGSGNINQYPDERFHATTGCRAGVTARSGSGN